MCTYRPHKSLPTAYNLFDPLIIHTLSRAQGEDLLMYRLTLLTPLLQALVFRRGVLEGKIGQFEVD